MLTRSDLEAIETRVLYHISSLNVKVDPHIISREAVRFLEHLVTVRYYWEQYRQGTIVELYDICLYLPKPSLTKHGYNKPIYVKDFVDVLYLKPREDMPLYICDPFFSVFAKWRLEGHK